MKLSIIIPIHNSEEKIERCLQSILNQNGDFEIIAVENASTDYSWKILLERASKDSRIVPLHIDEANVSTARNRGLNHAHGDCVLFVDADDYIPPNSLEKYVTAYQSEKCELVVSSYECIKLATKERKGFCQKYRFSLIQYLQNLMNHPSDIYYGSACNKLYVRELIEAHQIRFDESNGFGEDFVFNLQYLRHVNNVLIIPDLLYCYDCSEASVTRSEITLSERLKIRERLFGAYKQFFIEMGLYQHYKCRIDAYIVKHCIVEYKDVRYAKISNRQERMKRNDDVHFIFEWLAHFKLNTMRNRIRIRISAWKWQVFPRMNFGELKDLMKGTKYGT